MSVIGSVPPDGYYWWTPANEADDVQIVKIEHYNIGIDGDPEDQRVRVWFCGSDIDQDFDQLSGRFDPVKQP